MDDVLTIQKPVSKDSFLYSLLFKKLTPDILDNFHRPLLILDRELKVRWGNHCFYHLFQTTRSETEGVLLSRLGDGEWGVSTLIDRLRETAIKYRDIENWEVTRYFNRIGRRTMLVNARQLDDSDHNKDRHILFAVEDITVRKQAEERLQMLSFRDELTSLYNRRGFLQLSVDRLKWARRAKADSCLFYADMDGLKKVNDTYGHAEGDSAIVDMAGILKETFREADIIARFSGDEFVALMSPAVEGSGALVAERLKVNLNRFNSAKKGLYKLSLSIGSCHYYPGNQSTIGKMVADADEKLYELKRNRKNIFSVEETLKKDVPHLMTNGNGRPHPPSSQVHAAEIIIPVQPGLHLRIAARFVKFVAQFNSVIRVRKGRLKANGRSILELLLLAAPWKSKLHIEVEGADAKQTIEGIKEFFANVEAV